MNTLEKLQRFTTSDCREFIEELKTGPVALISAPIRVVLSKLTVGDTDFSDMGEPSEMYATFIATMTLALNTLLMTHVSPEVFDYVTSLQVSLRKNPDVEDAELMEMFDAIL